MQDMAERKFSELLKTACSQLGVHIDVFSDEWVFRLEKDGERRFVIGGVFDCNSQSSAAIARDKVATSALLIDAGVATVEHVALQTADGKGVYTDKLHRLFATDQPVIIKPIDGAGGRDVYRFDTAFEATSFLRSHHDEAWAGCYMEEVVSETRVVVLNGDILLCYRKTNPVIKHGVKLFNLHKGAVAESILPVTIGESYKKLALDSVNALGLALGAVDIILCSDGAVKVIEVNASFTLTQYAAINDATSEEVASTYRSIVESLFTH